MLTSSLVAPSWLAAAADGVGRLVAQLFIFDPRNWRGDRVNTLVHVVFTVLWVYLTAVPAWALWQLLEG